MSGKVKGGPSDADLAPLEARLGYGFADRRHLALALTHISAVEPMASGKARLKSYQRLEFLGDHVLGLVASDMLFHAFPEAEEGDLSRRLAELVCEETCAEIADEMGVAPFIRLGMGEAKAGGRRRQAILADIAEAVLAAVYLDAGHEPARAMVERFWGPRLANLRGSSRDPKTALQEWAQARGLPPPAYRLVERSGPDHSPEFRIAIDLPGFPVFEGSGRSKQAAQKAAAAAFLGHVPSA
ncbi:ribonuclease III [Ancylobacter terrae]|uniref:ribonuclease III n=1 Tax=Ancylobacter sp. sgz301288 TaxID=3342077 RepID=UPI00385C5E64